MVKKICAMAADLHRFTDYFLEGKVFRLEESHTTVTEVLDLMRQFVIKESKKQVPSTKAHQNLTQSQKLISATLEKIKDTNFAQATQEDIVCEINLLQSD